MIITRNLLNEFVPISHISTQELCEGLNRIGLETESITELSIPDNVILAKVSKKIPHPNADRLNVCSVDIGSKHLQIVCGAGNVGENDYIALAMVGAHLPKQASKNEDGESSTQFIEIKESEIRGVKSEGMICSSTELGLPKMGEGIMHLDSSIGELTLGKPLKDLEIFNDVMIELSITSNRGDCLSVLGIARDVSAYFDIPLKLVPSIECNSPLGLGRILNVVVENYLESSFIYRIIEVKNLVMAFKVSLTLALNQRFNANNALANYIEYATYMSGVILNAYNLDEITCKQTSAESIQTKLYIKKDERGLEGVYVDDKLLSLVGMHHGESAVLHDVDSVVILEASYLSPDTISKQVYELKNTYKDAASKLESLIDSNLVFRTTRGSNPMLETGMNFLCATLIAEYLSESNVLLYYGAHNISRTTTNRQITLTFSDISRIVGKDFTCEEVRDLLKRLNFEIGAIHEENLFNVIIPSYRHDITSIQDLSEEVMRIYGIDNVKSFPLQFREKFDAKGHNHFYKLQRVLSQRLLANRFYECMHYLFVSSAQFEKLGFQVLDESVGLINPIIGEMDTLRSSLIPQMINAAKANANNGYKNIAFFEIGTTYDSKRNESKHLCVFASGERKSAYYPNPKGVAWSMGDFIEVIGSVIGKFSLKNVDDDNVQNFSNFGFAQAQKFSNILHPYKSAFIYNGEECIGFECIGFLGALNPMMELENTFVCEIDLSMLHFEVQEMSEFSKFQKTSRDLTLDVDSNITFWRIKEALMNANIEHVVNVFPLDVYKANPLSSTHALSIRIDLRSSSKTLSEEDLDRAISAVMKTLTKKFDVKLKQ